MKASTRDSLAAIARHAADLAGEMRRVADGAPVGSMVKRRVRQLDTPKPQTNVGAVIFDVAQIASYVHGSDTVDRSLQGRTGLPKIYGVLEIALLRLGMFCRISSTRVEVDLGNGYHLVCHVEPRPKRVPPQ